MEPDATVPHRESEHPIIAALDLSEGSEAAVEVAVEEATLRQAPLVLLHVVDRLVLPIRIDDMIPPNLVCEVQDQMKVDAEKELVALRERFVGDLPCEVVVLLGGARSIHLEIAEFATARQARLLILASRGHGALYHLFLGSTLERVLQSTVCPILVVPRASAKG